MDKRMIKIHSGISNCTLVIVVKDSGDYRVYAGPKRKGGLTELSEGSRKRRFVDMIQRLEQLGVEFLVVGTGNALTKEQALIYLPEGSESSHEAALNA